MKRRTVIVAFTLPANSLAEAEAIVKPQIVALNIDQQKVQVLTLDDDNVDIDEDTRRRVFYAHPTNAHADYDPEEFMARWMSGN